MRIPSQPWLQMTCTFQLVNCWIIWTFHKWQSSESWRSWACIEFSSTWVPHYLTKEQMRKRIEYVGSACKWWIVTVIWWWRTWQGMKPGCGRHFDTCWTRNQLPGSCQAKVQKTKVRQQRSPMKLKLTAFFDSEGMLYQNFAVPNSTINNAMYQGMLHNLRYHISWKWSNVCDIWLLHHDNAKPHVSTATTQFLEEEFVAISHSLYYTDLAPADFWLFPLLKKELHGYRFHTRPEIESTIHTTLHHILIDKFGRCSSWNSAKEWRNVLPLAVVT